MGDVFRARHHSHPAALSTASNAELNELATRIAQGKLRPVITQSYPLAEAAQCLRDLAERRVRGKVVITMETPQASL